MSFEIFADGSSSLEKEIIEKYRIEVLEFPITVDGKEEKEKSLKELYSLMRKKVDVKTSLVNTDAFIRSFKKALEKGKDMIYIGVSGGLSGTYSCAFTAAEILKEKYPERKIIVLDSKSISLGAGLLVLKTCEMREEGKSIDEVSEYIKEEITKVNHLICISDLFYIKRSGRLTEVEAFIGSITGVRPLMALDDEGKVKVYAKIAGKKRAFSRMIEKMAETVRKDSIIGIAHCDCLPDAEYIKEKIEKILPNKIKIAYVDPVVGTHAGPDALAIIYFGQKRVI